MEKLKPYIEKIRLFWKKRHITQIILLSLLVFILLAILYFTYLASQANVSTLKAGLSQATVIYDKDGDEATKIKTNRTEGVEISDLPDYVPGAVVAIEDERFYQHNGFDIKGIARVFFKNIFAGRITGGGSTVTQQLTKNALLSSEQTYKRKAEELFLAVEIEKHYKKDEILQMYVNHVYFGSGAWGIDTAAQKYFDKNIKDVSISEAALLAGLLQAPSALDPYQNYDGAIKRRNVVLGKMKEQNVITNKEYKKAIKEKIVLKDGGGSFIKRDYAYYTDAVIDEAISLYGLTQDELLKRGYKIYTEMDQNLQSTLEKTFARDYLFPASAADNTLVQGGAVLLDPETGGVRGMVGGRGEQVFRGFNRATQIKAQPGSTLKPLAVYTPALEEGYKVTSTLQDKPFKKGDYEPQNFTKTYQGEVPMYEALEKSLNVPAVWLLDKIGLDKGLDSLERFGIPLDKEDEYLGIALGGMHKGVSPLQMAEAYSAFPNEGVRMESHLITKIIGPTGKVIAEYKPKSTKVTSKSVADKMTSMLLDVIKTGTGQGAQVTGFQIAGKTGSTQLPFNATGTKDQWFVGYTPNLVGAMWLGYDKTDQQHYLKSKSSGDVVPIFKTIMDQAVQYVEPENFSVSSVSQQLANEENEQQKIETTKKEIEEKAKELEGTIREKSSKWKAVMEEMKEDAAKVKEKIKEVIGN